MKYSAGLLSLATAATAQQVLYGQCGGLTWTGATTCVSGAVCTKYNDYYSQCVPGNTTTRVSSTTTAVSSTTTKATSTSKTSTAVSTATGIPKVDGTLFNLDGVTKYYPGTNSYWISFLTSNDDVDSTLDDLVDSGLKILRIWGFNDVNSIPASGTVYFQYLSASGSTINTGTDGLQRLDYIVSAAEARGIKLIIPFVNQWDDYGGLSAYVNAFGGSKTSWYTNTAAQAQYQAYIKAVVSRFTKSPAILAWELGNEPRCNGCDTSVIYNWAKTTSQYIKSLDPNHLVTTGIEGFGLPGDGSYPYTYNEGTDFVALLNITTLDFATFHLYPNSWGTSYDWGNAWVETHGAACAAANKPCLFEEYGAPTNHCAIEAPWQETALATDGIASDLFWQLGVTLSWGKTSDDGNTIFTNTSDWECLVTDHVADINSGA
ncbi:fungal cellulose binding domain-containing protein [Truncatella angustata]|uniref:Mannan endo-1,4-beta-mannosidase A n=1 Tax=Truncatella angustata TaxID=152316 RepID=A0A9P8UNP2_9PEZI|nr:fungal cellulose binding domain-containing protein [Truncatella angustata]KAH6655500.1 fungal cellulose binding domain-containing protein [Truncatella angustata]